MGISERREREREELRQKILDSASALFAAEGYENVSMRKIASDIEYSPTTIYLYFKDKTELLTEICEITFADLIREMDSIRKDENSPLSRLKLTIRKYVEFGLAHPNHYELTFTAPRPAEMTEDYDYEESNGKKAFEGMAGMVCDCIESGDLKNTDVMKTSQVIWAMCHGVVSLLSAHKDFPFAETEELIDASVNILMEGIAT